MCCVLYNVSTKIIQTLPACLESFTDSHLANLKKKQGRGGGRGGDGRERGGGEGEGKGGGGGGNS